ncbi:MAG: methyltransferase domain-containing protein [Gammaproteobacteria bacterium]|nr:methyltransferase domain-containing protein [Gammaproteobacteria bacterium]MBV9621597.1 methyltransferase domain-containing protein [Gammaproteobacteria bacterium]
MKLHLGCGPRHIPGYIHIDVVNYPHVDHVSSIDSLSFLKDASVEVIYNCHVLEHFKRREVARVLQEWRRVLVPGGVLRIAVPDFAALCQVYTRTHDLGLVIGSIFGRQDYLYNIHYNLFDFESLKAQLEQAGFAEVHRYDWRETEHAHVDDFSQAYIPHMDKDHGTLVSLNVECRRPPA